MTPLFLETAAKLSSSQLAGDSLLPGWTCAHVVAHVAANAEALTNLVRWAKTGNPSPMYASPQSRAEGISRGSRLPAASLISWLHRSASELEVGLSLLTASQWQNPVVTNAGRTVPATEITWMRMRETAVHSIDLDAGVTFDDLPADLLTRLCEDAVSKRDGLVLTATDGRWELNTSSATVSGPLAEMAAYLTGRPHHLGPAPTLPPWL